MEIKNTAAILLFASLTFGPAPLKSTDDPFEDLLKNFEQSDLPAEPQKKDIRKPKETSHEKTEDSEKVAPQTYKEKSKKETTAPLPTTPFKVRPSTYKTANPQEKEILNFVREKVVPLANKLMKAIESPEVAKNLEAARKNREAKEKAATTKAASRGSSKSRHSSSGGDRQPWRDGGKGWNPSDWRRGDSHQSSDSSSLSQPSSHETKTDTQPSTLTKTPTAKTDTEDSRTRTFSTEKSEEEKLKEERRKKSIENEDSIKRLKSRINNISEQIDVSLKAVIACGPLPPPVPAPAAGGAAPAPGAAGGGAAPVGAAPVGAAPPPPPESRLVTDLIVHINDLKGKFKEREEYFKRLDDVSDGEGSKLKNTIKRKERESWRDILAKFGRDGYGGRGGVAIWPENLITNQENKQTALEFQTTIDAWLKEKEK